jgi:hypothetical protein
VLREVAEAVAQVRHSMAHGEITAAREWAKKLVDALDRVPADRAAYEALCQAADRELAENPAAWDQRPSP